MAFQLSAGVAVSEIDLTTIIPAVGTTEAGFVGNFNWGPVNEIRVISSEVELASLYGKPNSNNFVDFYTAANFLAYGRNLKLVRSTADTLKNAGANGTAVLIKNENDYQENFSNAAGNQIWSAKWPGELGNGLKVSVFTGSNTQAFGAWIYNGYFDSPPDTSTYVSNRGGANDELHIAVVDTLGTFSGVANTVLERFGYVSKAIDALTDTGSGNYYKDVVNRSSKYIWWINHTPTGNTSNWGGTAAATVFEQNNTTSINNTLSGGVLALSSDANLQTGYDLFKNGDEVDISLIMTGGHSETVKDYIIDNIAEFRKDAIVFISPDRTSVVDNAGTETTDAIADRDGMSSSSYAFMDSGWKYQFDKYNNTYRWVPLNGDIAGLCVRTDYDRDPWFSPAGFNRGAIKNVVKLAWNPNKTQRDDLYKKGINPVVTFQGQGTVLYGDKTMLSRPSAFDRINVRRLFITLEKSIARAAKFSLFEFNDAFTRSQFVSLVEPYLRDVQGRRGIYDFRVVCDETNNTAEVIDRNEFVGDIYIKPSRSINFIQLNFVAVRTGVSFDEITGAF